MEEKLYFTRKQAFKSAYVMAHCIERLRKAMIRLPEAVDALALDWHVDGEAVHVSSVSEAELFKLRLMLRDDHWALIPEPMIDGSPPNFWRAFSGQDDVDEIHMTRLETAAEQLEMAVDHKAMVTVFQDDLWPVPMKEMELPVEEDDDDDVPF